MTSAQLQPLPPPLQIRRAAFTLIELLAVMSLIALFVGVLGYAFLRGGTSTVGLQGAQSTISSLVTLVRGQAAISGQNAALFVHADSSNPNRYLRFVVPAVWNPGTSTWSPLTDGYYLPAGCYVVSAATPTNIETGTDWEPVRSSVLRSPASFALLSSDPEVWSQIVFTPRGTVQPTPAQGNIVIANGRPDASGGFTFINPQNVRAIAVSVYGLTRLINERSTF